MVCTLTLNRFNVSMGMRARLIERERLIEKRERERVAGS